ncbi:MAG: HAD-IA family hydrolase [Planctomycetota bacterium]|nr:HAD-IA family hydrolase [Planctomycetota bacterium]
MKLKAIFFDIDDTLYSTSEFAARARRNSIDAMIRAGLRVPRYVLLRELTEVVAEFSSNFEHHFDKLILRLPPVSYDGVNPAVMIAAAVVAYHETKFRQLAPYDDVPPLLASLSRTNLVRGIITAGLQVKQAEKLLRLGVYQYLTSNAIFISDQIGISKPNVKLYLKACETLGLQPEECMHVGDSPLSDIDPANEIGMITVRSRRSDKYAGTEGRTRPRHEIRSFRELRKLLRSSYNVPV